MPRSWGKTTKPTSASEVASALVIAIERSAMPGALSGVSSLPRSSRRKRIPSASDTAIDARIAGGSIVRE